MGTSASENVAIAVTSTADTQALRDSREAVTALAVAAKDSSDALTTSFDRSSQSTQRFADALQQHEIGVERTRGATRGLALELSHLSFGFIAGEGSALGLVRAAGLAATELAELSDVAALAAGASAIGAIVTVVGTVIALFSRASIETAHFKDVLSDLTGASADKIFAQYNFELTRIGAIARQIKDNEKIISDAERAVLQDASSPGQIQRAVKAHQENTQLLAIENDLDATIAELRKRYDEQYDREADERVRKEQQRANEVQRIHEEAERKAADLSTTLDEETAAATDQIAVSDRITAIRNQQITEDAKTALILEAEAEGEAQAAINKAIREEQRREDEIRALQISEDEKTKLILQAQADRDAKIAAAGRRAHDKESEEQDRSQTEQQRKAEAARQETVRGLESLIDASIRGGDSYVQTVTKTLLTPLERYLEGLAASQLVDAAADAASFNFIGAAEHAAAAALAIEGARKVAQIGGLNSSGSAGSVPSYGAGSGASAFTPADQNRNGNVVVNLLTTDPYSRENIMIASYELQRAGILKRPLYVPPTRGMSLVTP
jgi:hypothetical protein